MKIVGHVPFWLLPFYGLVWTLFAFFRLGGWLFKVAVLGSYNVLLFIAKEIGKYFETAPETDEVS